MDKKFKYEIRHIKNGENILEKLNLWGQDGWEVISCSFKIDETEISKRICEVILKKEI